MFMKTTNRHLAEIERQLVLVNSKLDTMRETDMSTRSDILAKVEAETDATNTLTAAVDVLNENYTSVEEALEALKQQVANGESADFSDFDVAVANLSTATAGLKKAIVKGVPEFDPSNQ